jgi:hypothetical protein
VSMFTRADMPPAVAQAAQWIKWSGNPPFAPNLYGWSVRTRGTQMTHGSFEQSWLKAAGFKHHGGGWGYMDETEPACHVCIEPTDSAPITAAKCPHRFEKFSGGIMSCQDCGEPKP